MPLLRLYLFMRNTILEVRLPCQMWLSSIFSKSYVTKLIGFKLTGQEEQFIFDLYHIYFNVCF